MEKRKIISLILGVIIIILTVIMPFYLRDACHEMIKNQYAWSMGAWDAVFIDSAMFGAGIILLTIIIVLINVFSKSK